MPIPDKFVGVCDTLTWYELNQRGYFDSELETAVEKYLAEQQADLQMEQQRMALEQQKMQMEIQLMQEEHQFKMAQMQQEFALKLEMQKKAAEQQAVYDKNKSFGDGR